MIAELASKNAPLNLVILGLIMFFSVFVGIIFWTLQHKTKKLYERLAIIPLEREDDRGTRSAEKQSI